MKDKKIFANSLKTSNLLHEAIYRINAQYDLSENEAFNVLSEILKIKDGVKRGILMGIILNGVMAKRPTVDEVCGFIKAALNIDHKNIQTPLKTIKNGEKIITVAGSGKKAIKTVNISSCASIVAASLGAYVVKPCSSATSSITGSSDFIELIGADINIPTKTMINVLKKTGLGFFKIENQIHKFDNLYGGKFFAPHVLSFGLSAMVLPFKSDVLLYGLSHHNITISAQALQNLGHKNLMVVSTTDDGIHFFDEIGVFGTTSIIGVKNGVLGDLKTFQLANILKLPPYNRSSIQPGINKRMNVEKALLALSGKEQGAIEDMICVNAATILYLADKVKNVKEGYIKSKESIRSGMALKKLKNFIVTTKGDIKKIDTYL